MRRPWLRFFSPDAGAGTAGGGTATLLGDAGAPAQGGDNAQPPSPLPAGTAPPSPAPTPERQATPGAPGATPPQPGTPPGEPAPSAPVVPERYELKLPEKSALDASAIERTAAIARELGLSNEAGQRALDFVSAEVAQRLEAMTQAIQPGGAEWTTRVRDWEAQALADPEVGGTPEKLQATAALGKRVLEKFFPVSVRKFLADSGYGSHPDILRGFAKLAKAAGEGEIILPGPGARPGSSDSDIAEKFYGEKKKEAVSA